MNKREKIQVDLEIIGDNFYSRKFLAFHKKVNEVCSAIPEEFRESAYLDISVQEDYDGRYDIYVKARYQRDETDDEFIRRTDNLKLAEEVRGENERKLYLRLKKKYEG